MLEFYSAVTNTVNSKKAIKECLENALAGQSSLDCDLVIIHAAMGHNYHDLMSEAKKLSCGATIAGCSTTGVIGMEGPIESARALGIMAIKGSREEFAVAGIETMVGRDPFESCTELAEILKRKNPGINMIHFIPSFLDIFPVDRALEGIESVFNSGIPIFNGAAIDSVQGISAFQFLEGQVFERGAVAIGFADPTLEYHLGVSQGHSVIGTQIEVTRCEGNHLFEFNGQPAWKFYCEKLNLPESSTWYEVTEVSPLALELPEEMWEEYGNRYLTYNCFPGGEERSMYFPLQIKEGTKLWWTRRDNEKIIEAADYLGKRIGDKISGHKPVAVFHVECGSRGSFYFNQAEMERLIKCLQDPLCDNIQLPWLGWYAGGEFCPVGEINMYHHFSAVICAITRKNG